jgi:hypothetical protein
MHKTRLAGGDMTEMVAEMRRQINRPASYSALLLDEGESRCRRLVIELGTLTTFSIEQGRLPGSSQNPRENRRRAAEIDARSSDPQPPTPYRLLCADLLRRVFLLDTLSVPALPRPDAHRRGERSIS